VPKARSFEVPRMTEFDEMADNISKGDIDGVRTIAAAAKLARRLLSYGESETAYDKFAEAIFRRVQHRGLSPLRC
jgi:hypothetical protein